MNYVIERPEKTSPPPGAVRVADCPSGTFVKGGVSEGLYLRIGGHTFTLDAGNKEDVGDPYGYPVNVRIVVEG